MDEKEKEIKRMENEIISSKKSTIITMVLTIIFACLFIFAFVNGEGLLIVIAAFATILVMILCISAFCNIGNLQKEIIKVQTDYDQFLKDKEHRENMEIIQLQYDMEKEKLNHPECPMCKSRNTRRITTANRAVSVSMVGLASSKIGKQYECLNCKHKW